MPKKMGDNEMIHEWFLEPPIERVHWKNELIGVPPPLTQNEVIDHAPNYGGFIRETIAHHEGCKVRGKGRLCGCDPIVVKDFITPRETSS